MKTQYLLAMSVISFLLGMTVCALINFVEVPEETYTEIEMKEYASNDGVHWGFK